MSNVIQFYKDESGAVTVDWVVLTAAIVGIALAVISVISEGVEDASEGINDELVVASNFTFGGNDANWASGYIPLSGQHGDTWGTDPTWAEATYEGWGAPENTDTNLAIQYEDFYSDAADGDSPEKADYIAVIEQIYDDRGLTRPDGNMTADEIAALYS